MRRLLRWFVPSAMLLVLVAGCAPQQGEAAQEHVKVPPVGDTDVPSALGLVGLWKVTGAPEQDGKAWLRIGEDGAQLIQDCGVVEGDWNAADGHLVVTIDAGDEACYRLGIDEGWLASVTSYAQITTSMYRLRGDDGHTLARLITAVDLPPVTANYSEGELSAPPVTEALRTKLLSPTPLPDGVEPAVPSGRWVPKNVGVSGAFLEFSSDSEWSVSDGCNGTGGRWFAGDAGLVVTSELRASLGNVCTTPSVEIEAGDMRRVGMVGDELRLFDADGKELQALVRDTSSH